MDRVRRLRRIGDGGVDLRRDEEVGVARGLEEVRGVLDHLRVPGERRVEGCRRLRVVVARVDEVARDLGRLAVGGGRAGEARPGRRRDRLDDVGDLDGTEQVADGTRDHREVLGGVELAGEEVGEVAGDGAEVAGDAAHIEVRGGHATDEAHGEAQSRPVLLHGEVDLRHAGLKAAVAVVLGDGDGRCRQGMRAGADELLRSRQVDGGTVEERVEVAAAVGGVLRREGVVLHVLNGGTRGGPGRVGEGEGIPAERRRSPYGSSGFVPGDDGREIDGTGVRLVEPDDARREVDRAALDVGRHERVRDVLSAASHPEDIDGVRCEAFHLDARVGARVEVDGRRRDRLHLDAADRVAATAEGLVRVARIGDDRFGNDDVLLREVGDDDTVPVDLELPLGDLDPDGTVAEGEEEAEEGHPHVAVAPDRGAVRPLRERNGRVAAWRPAPLHVDGGAEGREGEEVDGGGASAGGGRRREEDDVVARRRVEGHEPGVGRRGREDAAAVCPRPERLDVRRDEGRFERLHPEACVPQLAPAERGDRCRGMVPGPVRERREPERPRHLEGRVERVGRRRRSRRGIRHDGNELRLHRRPRQESLDRVGDRGRGRRLEGEPAEAGEGGVPRRCRPRRHAGGVLDRLLTEVLGREDHDHGDRQLRVRGDDVCLAAGHGRLGVVELETQVEHVLRADGLEDEARGGCSGDEGAQALEQGLVQRPVGDEGVARAGCRRRERQAPCDGGACRRAADELESRPPVDLVPGAVPGRSMSPIRRSLLVLRWRLPLAGAESLKCRKPVKENLRPAATTALRGLGGAASGGVVLP